MGGREGRWRRVALTVAVAVAAIVCSSGGGSASPSTLGAGSTVATTTAASAASGRASVSGDLRGVFVAVPPYELVELPPSLADQARQKLESADPQVKEALRDVAYRTVAKNGQAFAVVIAMSFDRRSSVLPNFERDVAAGIADTAGPRQDARLDGRPAHYFRRSDGVQAFFDRKGLLGLFIQGEGARSDFEAVMAGLIRANT